MRSVVGRFGREARKRHTSRGAYASEFLMMSWIEALEIELDVRPPWLEAVDVHVLTATIAS